MYFVNYSLDPKAFKYSSSNYDYMSEKPLASSVWQPSNCPPRPNLQLAIDLVWESLDAVSSLSTPQVQQVSRRPLGCFPKVEELLLQSGMPLWLGIFLHCPPASAALFCLSVLLELLLPGELADHDFFL